MNIDECFTSSNELSRFFHPYSICTPDGGYKIKILGKVFTDQEVHRLSQESKDRFKWLDKQLELGLLTWGKLINVFRIACYVLSGTIKLYNIDKLVDGTYTGFLDKDKKPCG